MVDTDSRNPRPRVATKTASPDPKPQILSDDVGGTRRNWSWFGTTRRRPSGTMPRSYSDESFWAKVRKFALKAGREVILRALILYYCLQDEDTPKWARTVIIGALGYFIFPADIIPDFVPGGYTDDLVVLVAAVATVLVHIKPEHRRQAEERMKEWFGNAVGN